MYGVKNLHHIVVRYLKDMVFHPESLHNFTSPASNVFKIVWASQLRSQLFDITLYDCNGVFVCLCLWPRRIF